MLPEKHLRSCSWTELKGAGARRLRGASRAGVWRLLPRPSPRGAMSPPEYKRAAVAEVADAGQVGTEGGRWGWPQGVVVQAGRRGTTPGFKYKLTGRESPPPARRGETPWVGPLPSQPGTLGSSA